MKLNNDRRGPAAMTSTELSVLLGELPTGALCVEQNGQLIALPAQVLGVSNGIWDISLSDCGDLVLNESSPACLVADRFTTYSAIRGFIVQGAMTNTSCVRTANKTVVAVRASRVRSFSFAAVKD